MLKGKLANLLLVSLVQGIAFTSLYLGSTFAILGVNPVRAFKN